MDIEADYELPRPTEPDPVAWLTYTARVTDAERQELRDHEWLLIAAEHLGHGPLVIPPQVADDPRLTARERFVLAALLEVSRDVDVTTTDAIRATRARLFGPLESYHSRIVGEAFVSLRVKRIIRPLASGGWLVEGA